MKIALFTFISLLAYGSGFYAYKLTLEIVWDQTMGGDYTAVLVWGGIAFFIFALPLYLWAIHMIDKKWKNPIGIIYPLVCMLVFFAPAFVISFSFGSLNLFLPETMLFHSFFLTSGFVFGMCMWLIKRSRYADLVEVKWEVNYEDVEGNK